MTTVKVGENESLESALKRFKRKCQKDGIIGDIRRKKHTTSQVLPKRRSVKPLERKQENICNLFKLRSYKGFFFL